MSDDEQQTNDVSTLTMETLMEWLVDNARTMLAREGRLQPVFAGYDCKLDQIPVVVIPAAFKNAREKDHVSQCVKLIFGLTSPRLASHVAEIWTIPDPLPAGTDISTVVPPSQRSDRIECVYILVEERGGRSMSRTYDILRDAEGKPTMAAEPRTSLTMPDGGRSEGRFVNLLSDEALPPRMWPQARAVLNALGSRRIGDVLGTVH